MSNNSSGDDLAATAAFERVVITIEELYELCASDALSLGALKEKQLHKLLLRAYHLPLRQFQTICVREPSPPDLRAVSPPEQDVEAAANIPLNRSQFLDVNSLAPQH